MFSVGQIVISTLVATLSSFVMLLIWRSHSPMSLSWDVIGPAALVGATVLLWRMVGNLAQFNNDLVRGISPNDILCPVVTYTLLGRYSGFRDKTDQARGERIRAALTLISFVVNVITI